MLNDANVEKMEFKKIYAFRKNGNIIPKDNITSLSTEDI